MVGTQVDGVQGVNFKGGKGSYSKCREFPSFIRKTASKRCAHFICSWGL